MIVDQLFYIRLLLIGASLAGPSVAWADSRDASALACAKTLIRPMVEAKYPAPTDVEAALDLCLKIAKEPRTELGGISADLYRFEYCTTRPSVLGWFFSSAEGECALLSGDLPDLLGLPLPPESASNYTVIALNSVLSRHPTTLKSHEQILAYVTEVLRITAPLNTRVVLRSPDDIWKARPAVPERSERKLPKGVEAEIRAPSVKRSPSGLTLWTLYTWEDPGGLVMRNEILLWPDGRLSLCGKILASRVGPYSQDVRMVF